MFAILETGGKQYKVAVGDVIEVELIDKGLISDKNKVSFSDILLIKDNELHLGQPYVENGRIEASIIEEFKAPKIIVFKKKSKKRYKRTRGHRQHLHRIKIEKIQIAKAGEQKTVAEKEVKTQPAAKSKSDPGSKKTTDQKGKKSAQAKKNSTTEKKGTGKAAVEKKATATARTKKTSVKGKESK